MCGITGWIHYQEDLSKRADAMERMTETLSKRGPDDSNIWGEKHVLFGHKRLAVVDLEGGRQPMAREKDGRNFTICYNGELYNTDELRKELLSRGHTFQSHSDTEVLLASYIEWKEDCLKRLNGIFAFAVWDSEQEKLFIGRDRLGVKPLFYKEEHASLFFGSELKAILAAPGVKAVLDREGMAEVLGLGPARSPGSGIYKGVKELRPAHALTFSREGLKVWRYWNVESKQHTDAFDETVGNITNLFTDAVTRQLVSDVPVCTFLSGGVDSSAITAIAANAFKREGKGPLHTFSIDYEDNDLYFKANEFQPNSDAPWINKMTEAFGTIHHSHVIKQSDLAHYLEEAALVRDLPGMADIDSSLLWFCKEIKKDFVVSLSGECADEIFGGYPWFHRKEDLEADAFPWMRSTAARTGLLQKKWREKLQLKEYVSAKYAETVRETPVLEGESESEARRRQLFYLNMIWFMTTLLDRKDRMSMGASLEVRVPFADHRLVEYVWNVPWDMKMHENREKGILRKSLEGLLPHEVLYRKKSPYPKTHHPLYTKLVKDWLSSFLNQKESILHEFFDRRQLGVLLESNGSAFQVPWFGQLMTGPQLLAHLAQIHVWFEQNNVQLEES
ncbi:asparagine synthase (glutamine-hydrolyzing) [Bacillus lacus]|uniref:asparagine synthase (glutamine-hydrolyzing) n=1 Tax=Metabacillus lacus TaxID=1983721 RepID=A0A7X2LZY6_9BACI|nr:asparagine synthase (glutamine-hydrolyzing) [Metabacillus lacus]MRX73508.1 asparagine synthase (glutamine-hydrolyzing) [Metabacillus lacus]